MALRIHLHRHHRPAVPPCREDMRVAGHVYCEDLFFQNAGDVEEPGRRIVVDIFGEQASVRKTKCLGCFRFAYISFATIAT